MEYCKLVDVMTTPVSKRILMEREGGGNIYKMFTLEPGMSYKLPKDKPLLRQSLMSLMEDTAMSNKSLLEENGIEFEVIQPSCKCRKPYLRFKCVEVYDDESD